MKQDLTHILKSYLGAGSAYKGGSTGTGLEGKIHKLSSNENPWGPSPKVKEALPWLLDEVHRYPDAHDGRLRDALSVFYGGKMQAEQFITGNSGSEILEMIMRAFLSEGDECIVCKPGFIPYWEFSAKFGAKIVAVPLIEDTFEVDLDSILSAITDRTRLIILANPNNPTGTIIKREILQQYFAKVPGDIITIIDEVYNHYVDDQDYSHAWEFIDDHHVIGLNSFSKAFGLAGLRVGFAYCGQDLAQYVSSVKRIFVLNKVSLGAAMTALTDPLYLQTIREKTQIEKRWLYNRLDELNVKYWKSEANFVMIKVEDPGSLLDALALEGVLLRPLAGFGAPGHLRVSIGTRESNQAFIDATRKWAKKHPSV
ncbi:MAG: histidinol-phosphate transaminase [Saprospiraceae bacterium]|nr:histidinol-phosphate transaminase [Saprospiraceae bacterium]